VVEVLRRRVDLVVVGGRRERGELVDVLGDPRRAAAAVVVAGQRRVGQVDVAAGEERLNRVRLATLPPPGFTSTSPAISFSARSVARMAGPLALSSTSLSSAFGQRAAIALSCASVATKSQRPRA
jgi:hypothetical protein